MISNKKGGIITAIVFLIILIAIGAVIYIVFGGQFEESGERFTEEAAKRAKSEYLSMKLALLGEPVGEDECGNALGYSERSTGHACDHADNNELHASKIRDCCCCDVVNHTFDFGKPYAYKEVEFRFIPHTELPISVQVWYSQYPDPSTFVHLGSCDQTFDEYDLEIINKANKEGYIFSCYIRSTDDLEDAKFRYVKLVSLNQDIDYAKAEVFPALKLCEVGEDDRLQPGKGYWVYSHLVEEEEVIIPGWDYMGPIAIIDADPQSALTFEDITFDGSASFSPIPSCDIVNYQWDIDGDGTWDYSGPGSSIITHAYEYEGIYEVILRVTEEDKDENCDGDSGITTTWITVVDQYPHAIYHICYEGFYYTGKPSGVTCT
ncbi:MAG: PKD domain-containing protein [Candidatus Woesearchaeota archaeon]|nr:MAG: PKD domain-containing protein [Candidatus Woesearchaeota archaeon]